MAVSAAVSRSSVFPSRSTLRAMLARMPTCSPRFFHESP